MRDEIEKKMIESLPLIQLEKHRAHISKGQEYQVSDLFRVRLDSEDPILIGPESRKVKIPQFMRLRLPFAALDLRTIATKLESFLATNKDYTPPSSCALSVTPPCSDLRESIRENLPQFSCRTRFLRMIKLTTEESLPEI